jgi:hypothetical protein
MYNTFGQQFSPQFMPQTQSFQGWNQNLPRQEIIRVNGENGARAYQMASNSSALLLDESAPLVWLVQTDGAGYKTATPYTIAPYQAQAEPDYASLEERIKRLEDMINGQKSDAGYVKRNKQAGGNAGE